MSLVPILANGFCANPSAQQERARALHSTSRSLLCDGVIAQVTDKSEGCLKIVIVKCIETLKDIIRELKTVNSLDDVRKLLEAKTRSRIHVPHTPTAASSAEIVFANNAFDDLNVSLSNRPQTISKQHTGNSFIVSA